MKSDNEIIKALNEADGLYHISIYCGNRKGEHIASIKMTDIIDLINRQKSEIERLTNLCNEQNAEVKRLIEVKNRLLYNLKAMCDERMVGDEE